MQARSTKPGDRAKGGGRTKAKLKNAFVFCSQKHSQLRMFLLDQCSHSSLPAFDRVCAVRSELIILSVTNQEKSPCQLEEQKIMFLFT